MVAEKGQTSEITRTWHWHSSPETTNRLELSVLALVETLIAIAIYMWIASLGYVVHLIIAAVAAPFLLLRTKESTEFALSLRKTEKDILVFTVLDKLPDNSPHWIVYIVYPFLVPVIVIEFLIVRGWATLRFAILAPMNTLESIPRNWWRTVGCLDSFHPPEVLPGAALQLNLKDPDHDITELLIPTKGIREVLQEERNNFEDYMVSFLALFLMVAIAIPSIIYRYSLKGSSIVYLPLVWIAYTARRGKTWDRIRELCTVALHQFRRLLAVFVIAFVLSKVFLQYLWTDVAGWIQAHSSNPQALLIMLVPEEIPRWQLTSALNGVLVWVAFFIADRVFKTSDNRSVGLIADGSLRIIWTLSAALSFYTISVLIYNVMSLEWKLPAIGECWTPWCGDWSLLWPGS